MGTTPEGSNLPVQSVGCHVARFEFSSLPTGTYYFRVQGVGTSDLSPASPPATLTVATGAAVPGPPLALQVESNGGRQRASWRVGILPTTGPGTTFIWTPVSGSFAARLVARNACGTSSRSNEVSFTVQP